jgi:hypothetical protein
MINKYIVKIKLTDKFDVLIGLIKKEVVEKNLYHQYSCYFLIIVYEPFS